MTGVSRCQRKTWAVFLPFTDCRTNRGERDSEWRGGEWRERERSVVFILLTDPL